MTGGCGDPTCDDCATEWGRAVDTTAWDDRLACPECSREVWASELCECDNDPLCGRCHRDNHIETRPAA